MIGSSAPSCCSGDLVAVVVEALLEVVDVAEVVGGENGSNPGS